MALTDQVIMPGSDYQAICDATRSLTGNTGTLKSGNVSSELRTVTPKTEMWILNGEGKVPKDMRFNVDFVSKDKTTKFISIALINNAICYLKADNTSVYVAAIDDQISETEFHYSWQTSDARRQMIFSVPPHGELLTWLQQNAKKVTSSADTNLKDEISFAPSSNETILDYSDNAIDGFKKVTVAGVPTETKKVALSMTSGNQIIDSTSGKYMTQVTVEKPSTLIPSNIKKDINIGGVVGTLESGGGSTSETWVLDSAAYYPSGVSDNVTFNADFTSNGLSFSSILITASLRRQILYDSTVVKSFDSWASEAYRKLVFNVPPTGDLLTWLTANGVKQPANLAVQPSKDVTITSNGTTEITPDAPYDVMEKANLTVNVASGGAGFSVTFPATATDWGDVDPRNAHILLADGTFKSVADYSTIGGKTIENVAGIWIKSSVDMFVLRMTLSAGGIAQLQLGASAGSYVVTTAPNATQTPYNAGRNSFWWPVADTVISAIEMYNTD